MIKVRIDRRWWERDMVDIYLYELYPGYTIEYVYDGKNLIGTKIPEGQMLTKPAITITSEFLKALVNEGADYMPPDKAVAKHLEDSIKVRDKLLDLVCTLKS